MFCLLLYIYHHLRFTGFGHRHDMTEILLKVALNTITHTDSGYPYGIFKLFLILKTIIFSKANLNHFSRLNFKVSYKLKLSEIAYRNGPLFKFRLVSR